MRRDLQATIVESCSKAQKTRQVFLSALEKKFLVGGADCFVSDVIGGGLLGHLGPLHVALDANR